MSTTYLITGASRGIGRGLVEAYLSRPNNIVIAAVRDPTTSASTSLLDLSKSSSSSLILIKIESTSETDALDAVHELKHTHNIQALDIVIANAAIAKLYPRVDEAKTSDMLEHFHVNAVGPVTLFQAVLPLLRNSRKTPKFIAMGTSAGSIDAQEKVPVPNAVYGPSKAALNWFMKKIHLENENLIAFPVHPGWVQTEMGNLGARSFGLQQAEIDLDTSITGLVKVIEESTRESASGKFLCYDGPFWPW